MAKASPRTLFYHHQLPTSQEETRSLSTHCNSLSRRHQLLKSDHLSVIGNVITNNKKSCSIFFGMTAGAVGGCTMAEAMREAQPYFVAHRGSTLVVLLSSEIVDGPFLPSILEVQSSALKLILMFLAFTVN